MSLPLFALLFDASWPVLGFTIGVGVAIVLLHRSNLGRLVRGEERRALYRIPRRAQAPQA